MWVCVLTFIVFPDSKTTSDDDSQQIVLIDTTPAPNIFYIAVGCACALIAVIVTMIIAYYVKTKKIRRGMLQLVECVAQTCFHFGNEKIIIMIKMKITIISGNRETNPLVRDRDTRHFYPSKWQTTERVLP